MVFQKWLQVFVIVPKSTCNFSLIIHAWNGTLQTNLGNDFDLYSDVVYMPFIFNLYSDIHIRRQESNWLFWRQSAYCIKIIGNLQLKLVYIMHFSLVKISFEFVAVQSKCKHFGNYRLAVYSYGHSAVHKHMHLKHHESHVFRICFMVS